MWAHNITIKIWFVKFLSENQLRLFRTHQTKKNLQDEVHDMISDDHYHIGIRLHFVFPSFFQVSHEGDSRENN
jgi:hypothetical protein